MPGFSDRGISQISSVIRLTVMSVLRCISEMVYLVYLVRLVWDASPRHSALVTFHQTSSTTRTFQQPPVRLSSYRCFVTAFTSAWSSLYLLIHRRADQTCSQQPGVPLPRQGERRLSEDHPCGVLPVDHLRQPIEQQRRRVHIALFNRALPSPDTVAGFAILSRRACVAQRKYLLDRLPFGFEAYIGQGNLFKKAKGPGHGCRG